MKKIEADAEVIGNRITSVPLVGKTNTEQLAPVMEHAGNHHFVWVTRGGGRVFLDGKQQGFGPNTAIFIPAQTLFHIELSAGTAGWKVGVPEKLRLPLPRTPVLTIVSKLIHQGQLTTAFASIQAESSTHENLRGTALIYQTGLMAVLFQRLDMSANRRDVEKDNAKRRLMRRFISRVNTRYATTDTVRDYAQNLGVTTTHLTRVCRQTGGKPATHFIQEKVLEQAKLMLSESTRNISGIASDLGFQTPAYFSRVFSDRIGQSPRQFRKNARQIQISQK